MPTYDYECKKCSYSFEKQLPIANRDDPVNEPCPKCGQNSSIIKVILGMAIGDPVSLGITRPNQTFQNRLRDIHDRPGVDMSRSRYGQNITEI